MARVLTHVFLSREFPEAVDQPGLFAAHDLPLRINRLGRLRIVVQAQMVTQNPPPLPPIPGQPPVVVPPGGNKPFTITPFNFPMSLLDPDGIPYTKASVTMDDLNRYRDLRGLVRPWTLRIPQSSTPPTPVSHVSGPQVVSVEVQETISTSSAPPLVDVLTTMSNGRREFEFDLYRLGRFSARATRKSGGLLGPFPLTRVTLFRPDGSAMATGFLGSIDVMITAPDLRQSRGLDGAIRKWKLRVDAANNTTYRIVAQVIDTIRIPVSVLQRRINSILGPNGDKLTLGANWNDSRETNQFTLRLNDQRLAETFGIHDVLDGLDPHANPGLDLQNPDIDRDYVISEETMVVDEGDFNEIQLQFRNIKTTSIRVSMGASVERRALKRADTVLKPVGDVLIPPNLPLFALNLTTSGFVHLNVDNWDDGSLVGPKIRLEIGLEINPDGRLSARCWLDPSAFSFGGDEGSPHDPFHDDLEQVQLKVQGLSSKLATYFTGVFEGIFDRLMGGAFRFTAARWTGTAMEFDYITGVEPERKPNIGYVARGDFGIATGPHGPIAPFVDTWTSPNLGKIDHIVVMMMENRSFDHVLGYLSLENPPDLTPNVIINPNSIINPNVDGLTKQIIEDFSVAGSRIQPMREADFAANAAGLKTKLPLTVGHSFADVKQQLANKTMKGFAANFAAVHSTEELQRNGCKPQDVLGYYTASDLSMYAFLSREFAVCDRYFSSHPGPTLPNRMYFLTGDLQRDRNGEPRFNNGVDSTFFLSRDQTIFDILEQRSVPWRVYESFPSVAMLRMFARYAGEERKIRDIQQLDGDILASNLPSVTFIEPAMHDAPLNDDEPPADMLDGQHLVRRVYSALRANPAIWNKTMFIVTYDEHGGFFDHVVPPLAEVLRDPRGVLDSQTNVPVGDGVVGGVVGGGGVLDPNTGTPAAPTLRPNEEIIYGIRVPTFVISPWVEKGAVIKRVLDHTSILKTILIKFCASDRPFMSDRVHHAFDLGPALSLSQLRDGISQPPVLPQSGSLAVAAAEAFRIIRKREITGDHVEWHDFMQVLGRVFRS